MDGGSQCDELSLSSGGAGNSAGLASCEPFLRVGGPGAVDLMVSSAPDAVPAVLRACADAPDDTEAREGGLPWENDSARVGMNVEIATDEDYVAEQEADDAAAASLIEGVMDLEKEGVDDLSHGLSQTLLRQLGSAGDAGRDDDNSSSPSPDALEGMSQLSVQISRAGSHTSPVDVSSPHDVPSPSPSPSVVPSPSASNLPSPAPPTPTGSSAPSHHNRGAQKNVASSGGGKGGGSKPKVEGVAVMPFPKRAEKDYMNVGSCGAGAYGEVFKAVRRADGQVLALKVLEGGSCVFAKWCYVYVCVFHTDIHHGDVMM